MKKIQNLFFLLLLSLSAIAQQRTTSGDLIRKEISPRYTNGLIKQVSLAQLRASTPSTSDSSVIYFSTNSNNLNLWKLDASDNTSTDDGVNVIVSSNGKRLKKVITTATQTALDTKLSASQAISFAYPKGSYNASSNTPYLTSTPDTGFENGAYYDVTTAGVPSFSGLNFTNTTTLQVGDRLVKYGASWGLIPFEESVRVKKLESVNATYTTYANSITNGSYVDINNSTVTSASRSYSAFAVNPSELVKVTTTVNGAIPVAVYLNSSNGITGTQGIGTNGSDLTFSNYYLEIPAGTSSVKINGNVSAPIIVKKGTVFNEAAEKSTVDAIATNVASNTSLISSYNSILSDYTTLSVSIMSGAFIDFNGNPVTNAPRCYTVVSANSDDKIKVTATINGSGTHLATFKNSSGTIIGRVNQGVDGVNTTYTDYLLTIPSGTATITINGMVTDLITVKKFTLYTKAVPTSVTDALNTRIANNESVVSNYNSILSDYATQSISITSGSYSDYNGSPVVSSPRCYTIISANNNDKIKVTATINGTAVYLATFKNSSGTIISRVNQGVDGVNTTYTDYLLTIPSGTATIIINGMVLDLITVKKLTLYTKAVPTSVTDALNTRIANNETSSNAYKIILSDYTVQNTSVTTGYYLTSSGTQVPSSSRRYTCFPATNIDLFKVTSTINGGPVPLVTYKRADGFTIGYQNLGVNGQNTTYTDYSLTIPSTTVEICVNGNVADTLIIKKNQLITQSATKTDISTLYSYINSQSSNSTILAGKTVLFLGTSITEGSNYATQAPARLGGVGINKAVGSSTVRKARFDGTANGLAWQNYCYSLSQTLAEKDSIINNWNTIRLILTNNPPSTMDSTTATFIRNCSYERRLVPYLNGTYQMPDFFVLEHGRNDNYASDTDAQFTTVPAVRTNRYSYIGAMNFLIDLIVKANPYARICIEGHYENDLLTRVSTAQLTVADYWNIPINRVWEKSGFSQQIAIGSKSLWTQSPWNLYTSGQNTSLDMNRQRVYLPDGIHLHSATDGKAQNLMTNIVAEFLKGLN